MHKLMILGSMDEFVDLVEMAKDKGITTLVCDGYEDGPAKAIADRSYTIDVRDTDAIADVCKNEHVDGVISSFSDLLAECLMNIASRAGIPTYCTPDRIRMLREKQMMKQMFEDLDIPYPKSGVVHRESIEQDIESIGFPCVIKPVNGYGSRGVFVVDDLQDIETHFDEVAGYSSFEYIIAESYNAGFEFNMMTMIVDGEPWVISIADREKSHEIDGVVPHVSRIVYPSRFTSRVLPQARDIVRRIAKYVGITDGPLCMQFFYEEDKGIQVCEATGRFFGYEHELVRYMNGLSIESLLLDLVYDKRQMKADLAGHGAEDVESYCAGLYFHGYEGVIDHFEGIQSIRSMPCVKDLLTYYSEGETIRTGVGAKPYVVRIYLEASSYGELDESTRTIFDSLRAVDPSGRNLLYANQLPDYFL